MSESLLPPPERPSFRALYHTTFRSRLVTIECGEHIVICDGDTGQQIDWFMREALELKQMPAGLFLQARNGKRFQVEPDDEEIARSLLDTFQPAASQADPFGDSPVGVQRWQYAVLNVGMFNSADRMAAVLARAGSHGWELAATMDKASNWLNGMEKGFLLLKRPVPEGVSPKQWCVIVKG
jgi:hypothetical protein